MNPITCACHLQPEHPLLPTCTFASSPLCLLGTFPGKWTHLAQLLPLGNSWTQLQKSPEGPTIMSVVVATWPWGLCVQSGTAATSIGIHCEAWAHLFIPKDTSSATDQKKTLRMGTVISWKSTPVPYSGIKKKKKLSNISAVWKCSIYFHQQVKSQFQLYLYWRLGEGVFQSAVVFISSLFPMTSVTAILYPF